MYTRNYRGHTEYENHGTCNTVQKAIDLLTDDEVVTVDGYLGIVTVGEAEFDLELKDNVAG